MFSPQTLYVQVKNRLKKYLKLANIFNIEQQPQSALRSMCMLVHPVSEIIINHEPYWHIKTIIIIIKGEKKNKAQILLHWTPYKKLFSLRLKPNPSLLFSVHSLTYAGLVRNTNGTDNRSTHHDDNLSKSLIHWLIGCQAHGKIRKIGSNSSVSILL